MIYEKKIPLIYYTLEINIRIKYITIWGEILHKFITFWVKVFINYWQREMTFHKIHHLKEEILHKFIISEENFPSIFSIWISHLNEKKRA